LTRDWGPQSAMLGAFFLNVNIYPNDANQFPIFTQGVTRSPGDHGDYDLYSLGKNGRGDGTGENVTISSW